MRFSSGSGLGGAIVRWASFSQFAHVGFHLTDGSVLDATPRYGVSIRFPTDNDTTEYWTIEAPQAVIDAAFAWGKTQIGKPYDWSGIAGFVWRRGVPRVRCWRDDEAWWCSEYMVECFNAAGFPLLNNSGSYNRITPRDLLLSYRLSKPAQ